MRVLEDAVGGSDHFSVTEEVSECQVAVLIVNVTQKKRAQPDPWPSGNRSNEAG